MRYIIRLVLGSLFVYLVTTVAAFVYLQWWQAFLVSGGTFLLLVYLGKIFLRLILLRITGGLDIGGGIQGFATSLFRNKSRVLRNATIDVHAVRVAHRPAGVEGSENPDRFDEIEPQRNWYAFDVSIFPDRRSHSPMSHWDVDDLRLVPFDAEITEDINSISEGDEFGLLELALVCEGEDVSPDQSQVLGPQRLRFTAGIPRRVREVKFRYYFETFGRIHLPDPLTPRRISGTDG